MTNYKILMAGGTRKNTKRNKVVAEAQIVSGLPFQGGKERGGGRRKIEKGYGKKKHCALQDIGTTINQGGTLRRCSRGSNK